jgi:hypothetical protein
MWRLSILPTSQQNNIDNGTTLGTVEPNTAAAPSWDVMERRKQCNIYHMDSLQSFSRGRGSLGLWGTHQSKSRRVTTKQQSIDWVGAINEPTDERSKVINQRYTKGCDILCFCNYAVHLKPQFYDFGQPNMFLAQWRW